MARHPRRLSEPGVAPLTIQRDCWGRKCWISKASNGHPQHIGKQSWRLPTNICPTRRAKTMAKGALKVNFPFSAQCPINA